MTVDKCFLVSSNQKSWITLDNQTLLKKLSLQVRGENSVQCGKGGAVERNQGCKRASQKEGGRTPPPTTNWSWCGRDYKAFPTTTTNKAPHPTDSTLAEEFNTSFSPFEAKCPDTAELLSVSTSHCSLILQEHQVSQVLKTWTSGKLLAWMAYLVKYFVPALTSLARRQ